MKFKLDFQSEIDVLTQGELNESLSKFAAQQYERARGVKWMRQVVRQPGNPVLISGPKSGFVWDLKLITMTASAPDTITVYAGESQKNVLGTQTTTAAGPVVFDWGSHQAPIFSTEPVAVVAASGETVLTDLMSIAVEAPSEMAGKLIS